MGQNSRCPRCQYIKSWSVRRGKRRCAAYRYEWVARALPLRLTLAEWRHLLRRFVLVQSSAVIAQEAGPERQRVQPGSIVCSDTFTSYTGVAAGGYVHRLVDHSQTFTDRKGGHANGLSRLVGMGLSEEAAGSQRRNPARTVAPLP